MQSNARSNGRSNLFMIAVSAVGLILFGYSAFTLAFHHINFEWMLLTFVTLLMVSPIDIGLPKARRAVTLSETFIFISVLLYGIHALSGAGRP